MMPNISPCHSVNDSVIGVNISFNTHCSNYVIEKSHKIEILYELMAAYSINGGCFDPYKC